MSVARALVTGGLPLRGAVQLPGDVQVLQRALGLSAFARGTTRIAGGGHGEARAIRSTLGVLRALGADITVTPDGFELRGSGLRSLRAPSEALDAGSSPTALAFAIGLLSGQRFGTRVLIDASVGRTTRAQIVEALRARGAMIAEGAVQATPGAAPGKPIPRASIAVAPLVYGEALGAIEWVLREPDADAKTAILISGLFSSGATAVAEPLLSTDHTERWLTAMGVPLRRLGSMAGFDPSEWDGELNALGDVTLPGDTLIASVVAALTGALPQSRVTLENVGFNATRTGVFDALRLTGAPIRAMERGDVTGNEPIARVSVESGARRGGPIGGELPLRAGPAQLALLLAGLATSRGTTLHDAALFGSLGPDPFGSMARLLQGFGIAAGIAPDALRIPAAAMPVAAQLDVSGSPELGLCALCLALLAPGTSELHQVPDLDEHWPGLLGVLTQLGARIERVPG